MPVKRLHPPGASAELIVAVNPTIGRTTFSNDWCTDNNILSMGCSDKDKNANTSFLLARGVDEEN